MGGWVDLGMLELKKKPYNIGMSCLLIVLYVLEIMDYTNGEYAGWYNKESGIFENIMNLPFAVPILFTLVFVPSLIAKKK